MATPAPVVVTGAFDNLDSRALRFLQAASRLGELTVLLWSDDAVRTLTGAAPKFPEAERVYFLHAIRYVARVMTCAGVQRPHALPEVAGFNPGAWIVEAAQAGEPKREFCGRRGIALRVLTDADMQGFPIDPPAPLRTSPPRKKVVVTGSYDWFHSGHVRFFEEAASHGDLHVMVGHDANIRLLKGGGHPLFPEAERRFMVHSIRYVTDSMITTGHGWLDADPEIQRLKPDVYIVNEDGDKGGKREYCEKNDIEYLVLRRTPAPGLPRRASTDLRGF